MRERMTSMTSMVDCRVRRLTSIVVPTSQTVPKLEQQAWSLKEQLQCLLVELPHRCVEEVL